MMPSSLLALLLTQAWQLAALVAGVLLVNRLLGKDRPHLAHALWLVVLLKCVTPPLWSSRSGVFCWLQPRQVNSALVVAAEPVDLPPRHHLMGNPDSASDVVVALSSVPRSGESFPDPVGEPAPAAWGWSAWLVFLWLIGAIASLVISLALWIRLFRR